MFHDRIPLRVQVGGNFSKGLLWVCGCEGISPWPYRSIRKVETLSFRIQPMVEQRGESRQGVGSITPMGDSGDKPPSTQCKAMEHSATRTYATGNESERCDLRFAR